MLNLTRDEAERIAFSWIYKQDNAICNYGGRWSDGSLYVKKDMVVSFVSCNNEGYGSPDFRVMTKEEALEDAESIICDWLNENMDMDDKDEAINEDWRQYQAHSDGVQYIANYLMETERHIA